MRNLIVTEFISLDGVIENPAWTFKYWNDDIAGFIAAEPNLARLVVAANSISALARP